MPGSVRGIMAAVALVLLLTGCAGTVKNMREVPEDSASLAPQKDKAMVVFMRPSGMGFAIQSSVFDLTAGQPQLAVRQAARLARGLRRIPDQAGGREPAARSDFEVPSATGACMSNSILVVDDTRSMRKMVASVLQAAGYSVEEAGDGAEALDKAKARVFDLVVTDHNMPRMDGVTLVRALKERFDKHRQIARWTLPLWLYVSVTGVVIYWMLYRW